MADNKWQRPLRGLVNGKLRKLRKKRRVPCVSVQTGKHLAENSSTKRGPRVYSRCLGEYEPTIHLHLE